MAKAQVTAGIHLCASEREGFGHYLNEVRSAAATTLLLYMLLLFILAFSILIPVLYVCSPKFVSKVTSIFDFGPG